MTSSAGHFRRHQLCVPRTPKHRIQLEFSPRMDRVTLTRYYDYRSFIHYVLRSKLIINVTKSQYSRPGASQLVTHAVNSLQLFCNDELTVWRDDWKHLDLAQFKLIFILICFLVKYYQRSILIFIVISEVHHRSAYSSQQLKEWPVLSHVNCFSQWELVWLETYVPGQCCDAGRAQQRRASRGPGSKLTPSVKHDPASEAASTTVDSHQALAAAAAAAAAADSDDDDVAVGRGSSEEPPWSLPLRQRAVGRWHHDGIH